MFSPFDIGGVGLTTTVDESAIVTNGLVLFYDPGNTKCIYSGQNIIRDLTPGKHNGLFTGSVSLVGNKQTASLLYTGTTGAITLATLPVSKSFTIMCWTNLSGSTFTNGTGYSAFVIDNTNIQGLYFNDTAQTADYYDSTLNDTYFKVSQSANWWYNVCVTNNNGAVTCYYNTSASATGTATTNVGIEMVGNDGYGEWFNGNIGMVLAYNRPLTSTEVVQNYKATCQRYPILYVTTSLIPTMTNAYTPTGYVVSASSISVGFEEYKAFDNNASTYWSPADINPCWLQLQFPSAKRATSYYLDMFQTRTWGLSGSNDGSTWTALDSQTSIVNTATYTIANPSLYSYYRIGFTVGSLGVKTFQMYN